MVRLTILFLYTLLVTFILIQSRTSRTFGVYLKGFYRQVSEKHLERYLDEFKTRFNSRDLSTKDRFDQFLSDSESSLSYKTLTNSI